MASLNCWRCLARPTQRMLFPASRSIPTQWATAPSSIASFSISAARLNVVVKSKKSQPDKGQHIRKGKQTSLKRVRKKQRDTGKLARGKPILPGERKAWRKRVQLSNDNAMPVPGLSSLTLERLTDEAHVGQIVSLPGGLVDQLRTVEAFKSTQQWGVFRSPHMLIRKESVDFIKGITDAVAKKETVRTVITGKKGTGKSLLALQALSAGFMNNYVVINIPEARDLITAMTEYAPIPNTKQFSQPVHTISLLEKIVDSNQEVLSTLPIQLDHSALPMDTSRATSLVQLANVSKEPEYAWMIFHAFWRELLVPGRPPLMFAVDGLGHMMRVSDYRAPDYKLIHSHDLGTLGLFADALGGKTKFPNGAAIIGVTSKSNATNNPSMEKALEQAAAAQKGEIVPPRDPFFSKYDERVFESLKGVQVFDLSGVSKPEARSLLEYWAASGVLKLRIDERNVSERWTLGGQGVIAEMERASLFVVRL